MPTPNLASDTRSQAYSNAVDGPELRWPASAIWRPGEPAVRTIGMADIRDALAKGWDDFMAMPSHAIFLALIYPVVGLVLFRLMFGYDILPLIYPMITGFALIGPIVALGLYELSRRREQGEDTSVARALDVVRLPSFGAIVRVSLVLLGIFLLWLWVAKGLHTSLFGATPPESVGAFANQVFNTEAGSQLILLGNAVGFMFAVVALAVSVVSFPLLVDRNVGAGTAIRTSIRAVLANPMTMLTWGMIVVASLILGAIPMLFGLAVVLPVLGHATWHLYRKVVSRDEVYR